MQLSWCVTAMRLQPVRHHAFVWQRPPGSRYDDHMSNIKQFAPAVPASNVLQGVTTHYQAQATLRPDILTNVHQAVVTVRQTPARELAPITAQPGLARNGQLHHCCPMLCATTWLLPVHGLRAGHEIEVMELQMLNQFDGRAQMPIVHGIECTAEYGNRSGRIHLR